MVKQLSPRLIVSAAAEIADRDGFDAVTVAAVARRLGVQPASLYGHVRDRAAVLDGVHELAERIGEAVAGRAGREALEGLAKAHRSFAADCPGRWQALQLPASAAVAGSAAAQKLGALTVAVLRGYRLQGDDLVHATRMLGALVNGFITLQRAGSFGHREPDPELSWQHALTAMDRLLTSWSTTFAEEPA
jgi:AcrR family transcriptional regulator